MPPKVAPEPPRPTVIPEEKESSPKSVKASTSVVDSTGLTTAGNTAIDNNTQGASHGLLQSSNGSHSRDSSEEPLLESSASTLSCHESPHSNDSSTDRNPSKINTTTSLSELTSNQPTASTIIDASQCLESKSSDASHSQSKESPEDISDTKPTKITGKLNSSLQSFLISEFPSENDLEVYLLNLEKLVGNKLCKIMV